MTFLFFPYLRRASVTIPAGFVKLISQAFGHNSAISLSISNITGIVLNALNIPPAPFVSWPITPWLKGILSSLILASKRPTLSWVVTKSASFNASLLSKSNEYL